MTSMRFGSWLILLFVMFLSACGGGNSSTSRAVYGIGQKGGFVTGSDVYIYLLDSDTGSRTSRSLTTKTTDNQGSYYKATGWAGWVEVEMTGYYFDEVTGETSGTKRTLSGITYLQKNDDTPYNVNVFTDIAVDRIRNKTLSSVSFNQADITTRDEIKEQFNLETNLIHELDLTDGNGDHNNDNATLLLFTGALISSGITAEEWDTFTDSNDQDVFNKIASAVQADPNFLATLSNNVNAFIKDNDLGDQTAPTLPDSLLDNEWVNKLPIASAGNDQVVYEQELVHLSDNGSSDPDGTLVSYSWAQTGGAVSVEINDSTTKNASFTAPTRLLTEGSVELTFTLTITDDRNGATTDTVKVTVNPTNESPLAKAGDDQTVIEQTPVNLSASDSADKDGSIVSYSWKQVGDLSKEVVLKGVLTETASFTAPVQLLPDGNHVFTFELTVTDNEEISTTDTVTVTVRPINASPVAIAGNNQTVNEKTKVTLSAVGTDSDGSASSYRWTQVGDLSKPVAITNAGSQTATFTAPEQLLPDGNHIYTFELVVTDNEGIPTSDTMTVTVKPVNASPFAKAGDNQTVKEKSPVTLSAATSTDSDGSIKTYSWKQVGDLSKKVTLSNAATKTAIFTTPEQLLPDGNHQLTFELTVTDNEGVSTADTMTVTVTPVNVSPVAKAGNDQAVDEQVTVTLSAAASSDSDGDIQSYRWKQIGDLSKLVEITSASSKTATLVTPVQLLPNETHVYTFELTVTDNENVSATDTMTVTVSAVNEPPTANAGIDQTIDEKLKVTLDASASVDIDPPSGTASGQSIASFQWVQVEGEGVSDVILLGDDTANPTFTAPTRLLSEGDEELEFKLTVTDLEGVSTSDNVRVRITARNTEPVAEAGVSQSVNESAEVTLSAVASSDPDGKIVSYLWEQTSSTISGVTVTLNDETSIAPIFEAPIRLTTEDLLVLTFKLTVTDNEGYSNEDTTTITINPVNKKPVSNAGTNREENEQTVVTLNGSASKDPDGGITSYSWKQVSGGTVILSDPTKAAVTFTSPVRLVPQGSETLTFSLTVEDNEEATHTSTVNIIVNPVNALPVALVGADQTVSEGSTVNLDASGSSDSDSTVALTFLWKQKSGVTVELNGADTATPSFTAPQVLAENGETVSETLLFEVTVTDNEEGSNAVVESNSNHRVAITVTSDSRVPTSDPGDDQSVDSESFVTLDGSGSADADGNIVSYLWKQKTGTEVALSSTDTASTTFLLPKITGDSIEFSFELTVTDNEGYSNAATVVITGNPASVGHAYLNGPVIGSTVTFIPYSDMTSIDYTTTSQDNPNSLSLAGFISVTEGAEGLNDNELYIIKVSTGNDIDHDLDDLRDSSPTAMAGIMHSLMTGADLKKDNWTITPLTEIAYQQASSLLLSGASVTAIQKQLDNSAKQLISGDLTSDTIVNRDDLYAYLPLTDSSTLKLPTSSLSGVIASLVADESTLEASLESAKKVITTLSLSGGNAQSTAIKGDFAYVAAGGFGLRVVDITSANELSVVGVFDTSGYAHDIEIVGNYAYIADNNALVVVDISNPSLPVSQKSISVSGNAAKGLTISGNFAYMAAGNSGLITFDISDPANPSYLGEFTTSGPANDVYVVGNKAYVAVGTSGLQIINVTSKTSMSSLYITNTLGTANDVVVDGNYAYIADGEKGLQIIDINATPPTLGASLTVPGTTTGIKKSGTNLYLASQTAGIHLVDVTDLSSPVMLNTVSTSSANDLTLLSSIAYVSNGGAGLSLIDVSSLSSQPHILATDSVPNNYVGSIAILSDLAVTGISAGDTGVELFDITDNLAPTRETNNGTVFITQSVLDVDTDGTYVYVAVGEGGIKIINRSTGATTSSLDTSGTAKAVKVSGSYLYVADGSAGLKIINVTDPANPAISGSVDTSGDAVDLVLSSDDNYVYLADGLGGIQVISVNDVTAPLLANSYEIDSGSAKGVYLSADNTLYVSGDTNGGNGTRGIRIYDASTPGVLTLSGKFATPSVAYSTVVVGNYAYVSNESDGVQVIDITDKTSPKWVANIDTSGLAHDLAVTGDYIYIADQYGGLSVIKSYDASVSLP